MNRARIPGGATRPRHVLRIQSLGHRHGRDARSVVPEDPTNHFGLNLDDLAISCSRRLAGTYYSPHLVAVAKTATGFAELDAASEPAPCLIREILEEQRVHR